METMRKYITVVVLLLFVAAGFAQDLQQYRKDVEKLSSRKYEGRGYYKQGMNRAGDFIAKEWQKAGVQKVGDSYFQPFAYDVNVFHGDAEVKIDGRKLKVGEEWVMREFSPGCHGTYDIHHIDTLHFDGEKLMADIEAGVYDETFIAVDWDFYRKHYAEMKGFTKGRQKGIICRWSNPLKFYKAYSDHVIDPVIVWVDKTFPNDAKKIEIHVDNKFMKDYEVKNVIGIIPGTRCPDSMFVVTAHYDHHGHLGKKQYYPGANDNASGAAMLMSLARYYSEHRPEYSIVFIAFAGEEAGLRGSTHFVNNPTIPLSNIKYVVNLDMIGDNGKNLYVETNDIGERGLQELQKISAENKMFDSFDRGELAANSDHFPFTEKGVPAIMLIFEEGDAFPYYHTYKDTTKTMKFDSYEKIFKLLTDFIRVY